MFIFCIEKTPALSLTLVFVLSVVSKLIQTSFDKSDMVNFSTSKSSCHFRSKDYVKLEQQT